MRVAASTASRGPADVDCERKIRRIHSLARLGDSVEVETLHKLCMRRAEVDGVISDRKRRRTGHNAFVAIPDVSYAILDQQLA